MDGDSRWAHPTCKKAQDTRPRKRALLTLLCLLLSSPLAAQTHEAWLAQISTPWPDSRILGIRGFTPADVTCAQPITSFSATPQQVTWTRAEPQPDPLPSTLESTDVQITWHEPEANPCSVTLRWASAVPEAFTWFLSGPADAEIYLSGGDMGSVPEPELAPAPTVVYAKPPVCVGVPLRAVPPDSSLGWRAQFRHGTNSFQPDGTIQDTYINLGTRDGSPPYTRTVTVPLGTYSFSVLWTKLDGTERASLWQAWSCK